MCVLENLPEAHASLTVGFFEQGISHVALLQLRDQTCRLITFYRLSIGPRVKEVLTRYVYVLYRRNILVYSVRAYIYGYPCARGSWA